MFVRSELAWVVAIPVPCFNCEKEFSEIAGRLVRLEEAICPHCGTRLNLNTSEWSAFRDRVKEFSVGKQAPVAPIKQGL